VGSGAPLLSRRVALEILLEVERGRRLDRAWEVRAPRLEPRERRWVQELVFGVIRFRGRLDYLLNLHLTKGTDSLTPPLRGLLRMGAFQLFHMDSVPTYAAVSETVDHAREVGGRSAAGLANAVLRRLAEAGGEPSRFPDPDSDPVGYLTHWGSHPRWLVERWIARWGAEDTGRLVAANNRIPLIFLRRLDSGISEPLPPGGDVEVALREAHPAIVQDPAASAVVDFAAPEPGSQWADLCAAPGGKALALASLGATVMALDPSRPRLERVRENARRLGIPLHLAQGLGEFPPVRTGWADGVLVDAPCTGTGTLARHPDARWRLTPESPGELARVQDGILNGAVGILRPGGILVYSTCTLESEENEARVEALLARIPALKLEGTLMRLPWETGSDGAFAARFRLEEGST
jgi:16S rRNA (cytosine967-C5)-methyltransferase